MEPTRHQKALIETAAEIWQDSPEELAFQHVVLAHLGFPRSKTDVHEFSRTSGTTSLLLQAGKLWTGTKWEDRPLPYMGHSSDFEPAPSHLPAPVGQLTRHAADDDRVRSWSHP